MARYRTTKKDTLRKLAKKYGVTRKRLRQLNPDVKFGKKGGRKKIGADTVLKLGKGVGTPFWRSEIMQDPTYAAFDRQFDYNRGNIRSDFLALKEKQKVDLMRQDVNFENSRRVGLQGVDRSMDNRGVFRSGQREVQRGEVRDNVARARTQFIDQQGDTLRKARVDKQRAIGDLKRRRAEERVAARTRLTDRDAETKYGI